MNHKITFLDLYKNTYFPSVDNATPDGILAIGGDLTPKRLLKAYSLGIFPWYSEDEPILWWSPDPRLVLFPTEFKMSKSLRKIIKKGVYHITFDTHFKKVIKECQKPRTHQEGTWITEEMIIAYNKLHERGYAHSVEVWNKTELSGGLYGISLGRCFFGESMFSKEKNTSKIALAALISNLQKYDFQLIDCQVYTKHLCSLGAREIARQEFITLLNKSLKHKTLKGNWSDLFCTNW